MILFCPISILLKQMVLIMNVLTYFLAKLKVYFRHLTNTILSNADTIVTFPRTIQFFVLSLHHLINNNINKNKYEKDYSIISRYILY